MKIKGNKVQWIDGYEGLYLISDFGEIVSFVSNNGKVKPHVLKRKSHKTYRKVNLCKNGDIKECLVHRLVLETFLGTCPEGWESRHLNGNPLDNRIDNLAWGTPQQNSNDNMMTEQHLKDLRMLGFYGI